MKSEIFLKLAYATIAFENRRKWFFREFVSALFLFGLVFAGWYFWYGYGNLSVLERMSYYETGSIFYLFTLDIYKPYFGIQILVICLFLTILLHFSLLFLMARLRSFLLSKSDFPYLYAKSLLDLAGGGVEYGYIPFTSIFGLLVNMQNKENDNLKKLTKNYHRIDSFLIKKFLGKRRKIRLLKSIVEFKKIDRSDNKYGFSRYIIALILWRGLKSDDISSIRKYLEISANLRVPKAKFELGLLLVSKGATEDRDQALTLFDQAIKEVPTKDIIIRARLESAILLKASGSIADLKNALIHLDYILESRFETSSTQGGLTIYGVQDLHSFGSGDFQDKVRYLRREVQELLDVNIRAEAEVNIQCARQEESRQMVSFLSHTLTSATTGISNQVRKIAIKLAKAPSSSGLSKEVERLATQVSRMSRVESLVEVFKLYTSDPNTLREGWARNSGGGVTVLQVATMAIQQALLRFYFSSDHESDFVRLMPEVEYSTAAQEFMQDALALDMTEPNNAQRFSAWIKLRLPFLKFSYEGNESVHIGQGGARDIVIFSLVSEFLGNALKYAATGESITLKINAKSEYLEIVCSNVMNSAASPSIHGGKNGLTFVRHVCKLIDAKFDEPIVRDNVFLLRVLLPMQSLKHLN